MGKNFRSGRIGEEIRKIVSEMLLKDLKDPRLEGIVSVTGVDVTDDHSYATVYISVLHTGEAQKDKELAEKKNSAVIEAMYSGKGVIRHEISKELKLKHSPDLIFKMDTSLEYGRHIEALMEKLK